MNQMKDFWNEMRVWTKFYHPEWPKWKVNLQGAMMVLYGYVFIAPAIWVYDHVIHKLSD